MDAAERSSDDRSVVASPLDRVRAGFLPGMEHEVLPVPISDDEIDGLPRHTAERLLELHPDRYGLATALFFGVPTMSGREICRIARVGSHTLQMIIEREERGRTAAEWARSAGARLRALADMAMSASAELMDDPEAVREAGIKGLATLIRESTHAHALLDGRLPGQQSGKAADTADDYMAAMRRAQAESIDGGKREGLREGEEARDLDGATGADGYRDADGEEGEHV